MSDKTLRNTVIEILIATRGESDGHTADAILSALSAPRVPAGYALIPLDPRNGKPDVTNTMKADHHGYHSFTREAPCPKCALKMDDHYDGIPCLCGGSEDQMYMETIQVPWDTCKEIYKGMAETAMLAASPEPVAQTIERDSGTLTVDETGAVSKIEPKRYEDTESGHMPLFRTEKDDEIEKLKDMLRCAIEHTKNGDEAFWLGKAEALLSGEWIDIPANLRRQSNMEQHAQQVIADLRAEVEALKDWQRKHRHAAELDTVAMACMQEDHQRYQLLRNDVDRCEAAVQICESGMQQILSGEELDIALDKLIADDLAARLREEADQ